MEDFVYQCVKIKELVTQMIQETKNEDIKRLQNIITSKVIESYPTIFVKRIDLREISEKTMIILSLENLKNRTDLYDDIFYLEKKEK